MGAFMRYVFAVFWLSFNEVCLGANILIFHPVYASSHALTLHSVAESLGDRGHQVDIFKWKDPHDYHFNHHENITVTTLSMNNSAGEFYSFTRESQASILLPYDVLLDQGLSFKPNFNTIYGLREMSPAFRRQCESLLANKQLYHTLQEKKYDLAIVDLITNECGLALVHQLKVPTIGYWALPFSSWEPEYTTAFLPASHTPAYFSQLGHKMNFWERSLNLAIKIGTHVLMSAHFSYIDSSVQKYYPGTPYPSELLKNLNGMIINSDPALDHPRLLPPTFINAGGMHIRKPGPLPKAISEWMESSGEDGVVLFTMGFTLDVKLLPRKLLQSFLQAFSRFPQKFLVKMEGEIHNVPPNVKILTWIPQQDVLGHPKTRAFITHCGFGGVMEAAYHGVPMIGMPLLFDQGDNFAVIKERGVALGLDKETATADIIHKSLQQILFNPKYKRNAMKLSELIKDVKETPSERVIQFTEYMIRHKGAEHLKLASSQLSWVQYFSIDSLGFLIVVSIPLLYVLSKCVKTIIRIVAVLISAALSNCTTKIKNA